MPSWNDIWKTGSEEVKGKKRSTHPYSRQSLSQKMLGSYYPAAKTAILL